jgi:hypothetical protein
LRDDVDAIKRSAESAGDRGDGIGVVAEPDGAGEDGAVIGRRGSEAGDCSDDRSIGGQATAEHADGVVRRPRRGALQLYTELVGRRADISSV